MLLLDWLICNLYLSVSSDRVLCIGSGMCLKRTAVLTLYRCLVFLMWRLIVWVSCVISLGTGSDLVWRSTRCVNGLLDVGSDLR